MVPPPPGGSAGHGAPPGGPAPPRGRHRLPASGPLGDPARRPYGNGVLLWFEMDDFDAAVGRARSLQAEIVKEPYVSENGNWECWLHDRDGYTVVLTSPLPSR